MTQTKQTQNPTPRKKISADLLEELNMLSALANRPVVAAIQSSGK